MDSSEPVQNLEMPMIKGLGRRPEFDQRSRNFPVRMLLPQAAPLRSYTWSCPIVLDQGQEGACVGFAFSHEASARPVKVSGITNAEARSLYRRAQDLDEWDGQSYEGTSVLGGVKAAMERGWYTEYRWAFGLDDVLRAIAFKGPVVLGINWYEGMAETDRNGFVQVTGEVLGGHAILANAVSLKKKAVKLHNSWGPHDWGINGEGWISFDDLRRLLYEQGEACVPLGRKLPLLTRITGNILNRLSNF